MLDASLGRQGDGRTAMTDPTARPPGTGVGVALGAGLGMALGVVLGGGPGIALGLAIGAGIGVAAGAVWDALHRPSR